MLCILSSTQPFFRSPDDCTALAEIISIFGTQKLQHCAQKLGTLSLIFLYIYIYVSFTLTFVSIIFNLIILKLGFNSLMFYLFYLST